MTSTMTSCLLLLLIVMSQSVHVTIATRLARECHILEDIAGCECWDPHRPYVECLMSDPIQLPRLPSDVYVHTLHVAHNHIETITPADIQNRYVQRLFLEDNLISDIQPGSLAAIQHRLRWINLSYNLLTYIPDELETLTSLKVLDLSHNKITSFALRSPQFSDIRKLILTGNSLLEVSVPLDFQLPRLTVLALTFESVQAVDDLITYNMTFRSCTQLKVTSSHIPSTRPDVGDTLKRWMTTFSSLERLRYNNNSRVDADVEHLLSAHHQWSNLHMVSLTHNHLTQFPEHVLVSKPSLRVLDISHNDITELARDSVLSHYIPGYAHLRDIIATDNDINDIADNFVLAFPGLRNLDVSTNSLTSLTDDVLTWSSKGTMLHVSGNPWMCDCGIDPLRKALLAPNGVVLDTYDVIHGIRCTEPVELRGMLISELSTQQHYCFSSSTSNHTAVP